MIEVISMEIDQYRILFKTQETGTTSFGMEIVLDLHHEPSTLVGHIEHDFHQLRSFQKEDTWMLILITRRGCFFYIVNDRIIGPDLAMKAIGQGVFLEIESKDGRNQINIGPWFV
jgi:hypothetical protein